MTDFPLTITEAGSGEHTVLVLHGGRGPDSVTGIVEHFAPTEHVLAPTHPGWADTPRPDWFTGVDSLAIAYLDLLADAGRRDVTVIGSSFGGWVAAEMAVRDRGGVLGRLVLLDGIGPDIPGHPIQLPPGVPSLPALAAYTGEHLGDPKLLRRLARVTIPAQLIWGEDDPIVPPTFGKAYAAAFADGRFHTIPGVGHLPAVEAPEATFALIDEFLRRD
ncbi:MAG TPA: alpha/beta hydrolase [Pseudonocardiaceae bacterium]|nr:alpha/beta hydrolase [Pseudonocardiaceae bacterium]